MRKSTDRSPDVTNCCRLIVNADDLGITPAVNDGIIRAHLDGIVTSASIMPNGRAFNDAIAKLDHVPLLDIGIHLTLVEEESVIGGDKVPSLVYQSGLFHKHAYQFITRYVTGRIRLREIEDELDAQIQKVKQAGITISHFDSHQHLHVLPTIFAIVVRLAEKYDIRAIRIPRERMNLRMIVPKNIKRVMEMLAINILSLRAQRQSKHFAGSFHGFYDGGSLDLEKLRVILGRLENHGVHELMCHPGETDEMSRYKHWGYSQEKELAALTSPKIKKIIADKNILLTTYKALIGGGV